MNTELANAPHGAPQFRTEDLRIAQIKKVVLPEQLCAQLPLSPEASRTVYETRAQIQDILQGRDERILVVVGPCSIHDPEAAREYADRLRSVAAALRSELLLVMRVYFEKPRTTVGWKGLINDPDLDNSFHINKGLRLARRLLMEINEKGIPAGTEYLDLITPQYITDLISWGAIGARTTESQVHRELASGLSCPVGFKNSTDGTLKIAVDAIRAAAQPHHFLSLTKQGHSAIFSTLGNADCHIILRGGKKPNYQPEGIDRAAAALADAGLPVRIMVDCSHANSGKLPERQLAVGRSVAQQIAGGDRRIVGVMIESHLVAGRQDVVAGRELVYGQSITDACLGWDETVPLLQELGAAAGKRRCRLR